MEASVTPQAPERRKEIIDQVLFQCGHFWEIANVIEKLENKRVRLQFNQSSKSPQQWKMETLKVKRKDRRIFKKLKKIKELTNGKKSHVEVGSRILWSYKNGPYRVVQVQKIDGERITILALIQEDLCEIALNINDQGLWNFSPEDLYIIAKDKYRDRSKSERRGSFYKDTQYFCLRDELFQWDIGTKASRGYVFADSPKVVSIPKENVYKGCTVEEIFEIMHGKISHVAQSAKGHDYTDIILREDENTFRKVQILDQEGYTVVFVLHKQKVSRPLSSKDILPIDPFVLVNALQGLESWSHFLKGKKKRKAMKEYANLVNDALEDFLGEYHTPTVESSVKKGSEKSPSKTKHHRLTFSEYSERPDLQQYLLGGYEVGRFRDGSGRDVPLKGEEYQRIVRELADELSRIKNMTPSEKVPVHVQHKEIVISGRRTSATLFQSDNIEKKVLKSNECYRKLVESCGIMLAAQSLKRNERGQLAMSSLVGTWITEKNKEVQVEEHDDGSLSFNWGRKSCAIKDCGSHFEVPKLNWRASKSAVTTSSKLKKQKLQVESFVVWRKGKSEYRWIPKDHESIMTPHSYKQVLAVYHDAFSQTDIKDFADVTKNRESNPKKGWKLKFHDEMSDRYVKLSEHRIKMKQVSRDPIIRYDRQNTVENIDYLWRHTNFGLLIGIYNLTSKRFSLEVGPFSCNLLTTALKEDNSFLIKESALLRGVRRNFGSWLDGITGIHYSRTDQVLRGVEAGHGKRGDYFLFQDPKRANLYFRVSFSAYEGMDMTGKLGNLEGRGGAKVIEKNWHGIPMGSVIQEINGNYCFEKPLASVESLLDDQVDTDFYIKFYPKNSPYSLEVGSEISVLTKEKKWRRGRVKDMDLSNSELKVEYIGYAARYNEWIDLTDRRLWCYSSADLYDIRVPQIEEYEFVADISRQTRFYDPLSESIKESAFHAFAEDFQLFSVRQEMAEHIRNVEKMKFLKEILGGYDLDGDVDSIRRGIFSAVHIIIDFLPISGVDSWTSYDVQSWLLDRGFSKETQAQFHGKTGREIRHLDSQKLMREYHLTPSQAYKFINDLHPERALTYKTVKAAFCRVDPYGMGSLTRNEFLSVCRKGLHIDHVSQQDLIILFNLICHTTIVPQDSFDLDCFNAENGYDNLQTVDYDQFYRFLERIRNRQDDYHEKRVKTAKQKLEFVLNFPNSPIQEEVAQKKFEGTYIINHWGKLMISTQKAQVIEDHIRQEGAANVIAHVNMLLDNRDQFDREKSGAFGFSLSSV